MREFPQKNPLHVGENPWVKLDAGRYTLAVGGQFNGATCYIERHSNGGAAKWLPVIGPFTESIAVQFETSAAYRYRLRIEGKAPDLSLVVE